MELLQLPAPVPLAQMGFWDREIVRTYGMAMKVLRRSAGLSPADAAEKLGALVGHPVSPQAITMWEAGNGFPPLPLFARLDQVFDVETNGLRLRATGLWAERVRLLEAERKAAADAEVALKEDGRPPRGRRRPRSNKALGASAQRPGATSESSPTEAVEPPTGG